MEMEINLEKKTAHTISRETNKKQLRERKKDNNDGGGDDYNYSNKRWQ